MQNPICISTGVLYKITNDRNRMIEMIKRFSPDGIEILFAFPEYLTRFRISNENLTYLRTLKYVSIHAPWKEIVYSDNKKSEEVLKAIKKLYNSIKARNVVFHKENIKDFDVVTNSGFVASLENDDWKGGCNTVRKVDKVLNENKKLRFTFDFAHATSILPKDVPAYITKFKDELIEIHLSILSKETSKHRFLHQADNQEIRKLLDNLRFNEIPFILEAVALSKDEIKLIKQEMDYIKNL